MQWNQEAEERNITDLSSFPPPPPPSNLSVSDEDPVGSRFLRVPAVAVDGVVVVEGAVNVVFLSSLSRAMHLTGTKVLKTRGNVRSCTSIDDEKECKS